MARFAAADLAAGVGPGGEPAAVHELPLERGEERFRGTVVEADPGGTHRLGDGWNPPSLDSCSRVVYSR